MIILTTYDNAYLSQKNFTVPTEKQNEKYLKSLLILTYLELQLLEQWWESMVFFDHIFLWYAVAQKFETTLRYEYVEFCPIICVWNSSDFLQISHQNNIDPDLNFWNHSWNGLFINYNNKVKEDTHFKSRCYCICLFKSNFEHEIICKLNNCQLAY